MIHRNLDGGPKGLFELQVEIVGRRILGMLRGTDEPTAGCALLWLATRGAVIGGMPREEWLAACAAMFDTTSRAEGKTP